MSDPIPSPNIGEQPQRLSDAIREVRVATADRDDVVVDLREAQRTRLELLAQELAPVFAEVPEDNPNFDFAISSGEQPRLWIDAVSHVTMGRDRRTYRFLRDTRLGRIVLAESTDLHAVAEQVTRYIAERIVERERFLEGDLESHIRNELLGYVTPANSRSSALGAFFSGLVLVIAGGAVGVVAMLFYLSLKYPELGIGF
ncbi:hypothetical protein L598_002200000270 [Mesorhizobium sp. J18]|uniref:hypothetical protein n=1 Tax=Mesorhizobium sp. J18 TaxID=935263 RepID=UPI00119C42AA|nr:hypothetical protein [Mesorhizobium sp. J18]TWG97143.1 hypothetical protein L598_002200000270 [Mesorhizobium sp. J18]